MPERDRTEARRQLAADLALVGGDAETPEEKNAAWNRISAAYDGLIAEADTADEDRRRLTREVLPLRARCFHAERERDKARKAMAQIRRRSEPGSLIHELARAALASLTDTDSEGDPVLDALARGDESMAARLTTEREQMLRGRVVLTAEEAEQIASRLNHVIRRADTSTWSQAHLQDALALLRGQEHPKARLDAANPQ